MWPRPFPDFWVRPGEWGWGYMWLMVPSSALPISYHCQHKLKGRPRNEGTLSSCIMVSITLTVWGGSWAGGTESVMWITRDWVGHEEIHQVKECRKTLLSSRDFILIVVSLDFEVWYASLVPYWQWKSASFTISFSNEEAVIWDTFQSCFCSLPWDPAVVPRLSLQFSWKYVDCLEYVNRFLWVGGGSCRTVNMVNPTNTTAWLTETVHSGPGACFTMQFTDYSSWVLHRESEEELVAH